MTRLFILFACLFLSLLLNSQSVSRVEVKGVILSKSNDVEAVTIFNKSSNEGTITNFNGEFIIKVAKNDVIEISALQFQTVNLTIDADIVEYEILKIQLVEQVNSLDAVLLYSGLTGNINEDIINVKTVKPIVLDMGNMDIDFEYNDIKAFDKEVVQDHLTSIITPDARKYMPDFVEIFKLITKSKVNLSPKINFFENKRKEKPKYLLDIYTHDYIQETFNIPPKHIQAFIAFVENDGIHPIFLEPENEIRLIQFLIRESELFLKQDNVKN
ncbi:MAG: carboxypeptidase-like regulatory domain-containing protein [Flavobacteriaceae bacterium]